MLPVSECLLSLAMKKIGSREERETRLKPPDASDMMRTETDITIVCVYEASRRKRNKKQK